MNDKQTITVSRTYTQSCDRVFAAWLDPAMTRKFLFCTEGGEVIKTEIDPRVGGKFEIVDRRDGVDVAHIGEYIEIDPPRRLVFTFAVPMYSAELTTVIIDIEPVGDGCRLTLTQENTLPEWAERTTHGWATILSTLDQVLS